MTDEWPSRAKARRTLGHYERGAAEFWEATRAHDVSQNLDALLDAVGGAPPRDILDFGCGPGRDLAELSRRGHRAVGLDGAAEFVAMARAHSGCEVWHQGFLELSLPPARFDGVFANASLFHVPSTELPRVLAQLREALRPRGVLFASNPRGDGTEGWNGERWGAYHDLDGWTAHVERAGFVVERHYYRPTGLPREQQPWLCTVSRAR
ncbi:MAG: methyltransferase domain-containing protein [Polyangiaceae bacterium]|nr:methyltransferase domain-containing protein [Polyangiaceae bacterium]